MAREDKVENEIHTRYLKGGGSATFPTPPDDKTMDAVNALQKAIAEKGKPYCPDCNAIGVRHCAHPEYCGNVIYPDATP